MSQGWWLGQYLGRWGIVFLWLALPDPLMHL